MEKYSLADIGALLNNRGDNFLEGNGIILIALFFLLFGGFGWGRNNNGLTRDVIASELATSQTLQDVQAQLRGITNGLCDGFYAVNTGVLTAQNNLQKDLAMGFGAVTGALAENRFAQEKCCCETNRNIDAVRYDAAKNTCDIINNATANTQKILDVLCADRIQMLRDKVVEKDQMLQTAQFQISQQAQSASIIKALQSPTPVPAYLTCSPFQAQTLALGNLYGLNNCNTCGCGYSGI